MICVWYKLKNTTVKHVTPGFHFSWRMQSWKYQLVRCLVRQPPGWRDLFLRTMLSSAHAVIVCLSVCLSALPVVYSGSFDAVIDSPNPLPAAASKFTVELSLLPSAGRKISSRLPIVSRTWWCHTV